MPCVLVVSKDFPPLGSAGASIRLVKLMKFASQSAWSFIVITQNPEFAVGQGGPNAACLLGEIPPGSTILRIPNPLAFLSAVRAVAGWRRRDTSVAWGAAAIWTFCLKHRQADVDMVYATTPPFTNAAVGAALATILRVPLVLDVRDDWVGSSEYKRKPWMRRVSESWIERVIANIAAAVVVVTRASHYAWLSRYRGRGAAPKIYLVPNGADLDEIRLLHPPERRQVSTRFKCVSSASGYQPEYRDLAPLLRALEIYFMREPGARTRIDIEFIGDEPAGVYRTWLGRLLPRSAVRYRGVVDRKGMIWALAGADMYFLIQPLGNNTAIPGTLYEYWAMGRAPVLLFAEHGEAAELVRRHRLGRHFHFSEVEEASRYIERVQRAHRAGRPVRIKRSGVEAYDRRKTSDAMIAIWSEILSTKQEF